MNKYTTRIVEEKLAGLFSEKKRFSENLFKWEDPFLPDKYDHNCFEYTGQPVRAEFEAALAYQKDKGDGFIKLEGHHPLEDCFGLESGVSLTMVLRDDCRKWELNENVRFATPSPEELEEIELKHYGPVYGDDFTRRNIRRLSAKLRYHGAYAGDRLAAACYSFSSDGMICVDGLLTDEEYRNRHIAVSLLAHVADTNRDSTLFLHAGDDDSPKDMYLKLGFEITDRLYEYSRMDIAGL